MNLFAAVHARVVGADLVADPAKATHACLTPAHYQSVADLLPAETMVTLGGAHPPESAQHRVWSYYGAAELSFVAAGTPLRAFEAVEIDVRDGVIWVRSPYVAEEPVIRDGEWATAGDLGRLDGDVLTVWGRPETVNTAGVTVRLAEVERVLTDATGIDVVCFGLPHPRLGEVLVAAHVGGEIDTLRAAARNLLDPGHRPRRWVGVEVLPVTDNGKPDRAALRSAFLQ